MANDVSPWQESVDETAARAEAFSPLQVARMQLQEQVRSAFIECLKHPRLASLSSLEKAQLFKVRVRRLRRALHGTEKVPLRWLAKALVETGQVATLGVTTKEPVMHTGYVDVHGVCIDAASEH